MNMAERNVARMNGFIRAVADQSHPLQTRLSLILTDFEPNKNKQGIPKAEAENILRTALHTPLKINFNGISYSGHTGAIPIGPIVNAYASTDNGREVIAGEAVIWNDIYEDIAGHLKVAFAEGIGTSWEIYFQDSEKDTNGTEWLNGCVFAGTCVVETPAYGPNRTRVLAIAETLNERAEELTEKIKMANQVETPETTDKDVEEVVTPAVAADDASTLREDIGSLMSVLSGIYEGLYTMLDETYELEANLVTNDMPSMAEQFTKLVASVTKRFDALKDKAAKAETAEAELTTLKDSIAQAEAAKALAEKLDSRKNALAEVGIEMAAEKQDFYLSMADDAFETYVSDLKSVRGNGAKAEVKTPVIPEPSVNGATATITVKELAAILRGE